LNALKMAGEEVTEKVHKKARVPRYPEGETLQRTI